MNIYNHHTVYDGQCLVLMVDLVSTSANYKYDLLVAYMPAYHFTGGCPPYSSLLEGEDKCFSCLQNGCSQIFLVCCRMAEKLLKYITLKQIVAEKFLKYITLKQM